MTECVCSSFVAIYECLKEQKTISEIAKETDISEYICRKVCRALVKMNVVSVITESKIRFVRKDV